jgi:hypothetical protein
MNYADERFRRKQKANSLTAKIFAGIKNVIEYSPEDIDEEFKKKHQHIFDQKRGGGFYLWKPYLIFKTLEQLNEGDYLFYCDSGAIFLKSIRPIIKEFDRLQQPILGFEIPLIEKQWTKKDTFIIMNANDDQFRETQQICSGYIFIKKCDQSLKFFKEFFDYATDERALTDIHNKLGFPNDSSFVDHRHDQSIFSLLFKKYGFKTLPDPSDFGHFPEAYCQKDGYQYADRLQLNQYAGLILSNRTANPLIYAGKYLIKRRIKKLLPSFYNKKFNPRKVTFRLS